LLLLGYILSSVVDLLAALRISAATCEIAAQCGRSREHHRNSLIGVTSRTRDSVRAARLTVVPLAKPPNKTTSIAPLLIKLPLATPPEETTSRPPACKLTPESVVPDPTLRVTLLLTTIDMPALVSSPTRMG
jgi:hypothetical protein